MAASSCCRRSNYIYLRKKMAALISQNRRIKMDLCMSSDLPTAVFFFSAAGQMEVTYDVCY